MQCYRVPGKLHLVMHHIKHRCLPNACLGYVVVRWHKFNWSLCMELRFWWLIAGFWVVPPLSTTHLPEFMGMCPQAWFAYASAQSLHHHDGVDWRHPYTHSQSGLLGRCCKVSRSFGWWFYLVTISSSQNAALLDRILHRPCLSRLIQTWAYELLCCCWLMRLQISMTVLATWHTCSGSQASISCLDMGCWKLWMVVLLPAKLIH